MIDELQVFDEAISLEQIQQLQFATTTGPTLTAVPDGDEIVLSWKSSASFQLQYRGDAAQGTWENETTPPQVSGNLRTLRLPLTSANRFYQLRSP
ncbi:MAG TPA: hypothetical protein VK846_06290 [Candidatus Limnocylindria bacterium]|nr:hypothetical protein [Candidatus Limnocylindria bacterium]